jgi:hypothetical protein
MPPSSSISSSDLLRIGRRLSRFTPIGALVLVTNLWLDPETGMPKGALERLAVERLQSGWEVRFNPHDRLFQQLHFERARASVEALVLGSSRCMPINTREVGGRSLWNASVSAAGLEELAVMYLLAADSRLAPRTVFVGLDLAHFMPVTLTTRWKRRWFLDEFERAGRELGIPLVPRRDLARVRLMSAFHPLSPGDFQAAFLRGARRLLRPRDFLRPTDELVARGEAGAYIVRRTDGSLSFPPRPFRAVAGAEAAQNAVPPWEGETANLHEAGIRILEALIAKVRLDGREVVLVLPPYHPDFAARTRAGPLLAEVEHEVRRRARTSNVPLLGSFDAATCGCAPADFYDSIHPTDVCFDRFLPAQLGLTP